jgi:hypothetical protein
MVQLGDQFSHMDESIYGPLEKFQPRPDPRQRAGRQSHLWDEKQTKPRPSLRYQRGYTPERMNEVRQLPIDIEPGEASSGAAFTGQGAERHVHEVIARSTTPAREVSHPLWAYGEEKNPDDVWSLKIATGRNLSDIGATGTYSQGSDYGRGQISLGEQEKEHAAGQSLIHEMGHYRSANIEHTNAYETPTQKGKEEARADDNLVERWRPDPRDLRRGSRAAAKVERIEGDQEKDQVYRKELRGLKENAALSKPAMPVYEHQSAFQGSGGKVAAKAYTRARRTPFVNRLSGKGGSREAGISWEEGHKRREAEIQADDLRETNPKQDVLGGKLHAGQGRLLHRGGENGDWVQNEEAITSSPQGYNASRYEAKLRQDETERVRKAQQVAAFKASPQFARLKHLI